MYTKEKQQNPHKKLENESQIVVGKTKSITVYRSPTVKHFPLIFLICKDLSFGSVFWISFKRYLSASFSNTESAVLLSVSPPVTLPHAVLNLPRCWAFTIPSIVSARATAKHLFTAAEVAAGHRGLSTSLYQRQPYSFHGKRHVLEEG